MKSKSVFFTPDSITKIRNFHHSGRQTEDSRLSSIIADAAWWMEKSYDELWGLMFGPTLKRSWMVLSGGDCPVCKNVVPMYDWRIDAKKAPWKVTCPHCGEQFPKNDFAAYYSSGLDEQGIFRYERALVNLLVNESGDGRAKNAFVDDGNGWVDENGSRRMFIATYLVYGQWRELIVSGMRCLAEAYVLTGDREYARRALLLMDRTADLFPGFDYRTQGVMYEQEHTTDGFVSYWVEGCIEIREMAVAYDQIFDAVRDDDIICDYLCMQSSRHALQSAKSCFTDIQKNIETRIFKEAQEHIERIMMNFPHTEITLLVVDAVLGWPDNRENLLAQAGKVIEKATAVDGVTGEKGTCAYSSIGPAALTGFFCFFSAAIPDLFDIMLARYPALMDTYRFHIDTWCLEKFYPGCGDMNGVGRPVLTYGDSIINPRWQSALISDLTMHFERFFWELYLRTGNVNFARIIYLSYGRSAAGCFSQDPTVEDVSLLESALAAVIEECGPYLEQTSVNKKNWRLAIFHAGEGKNKRCAWIDYDSGGQHGHEDALNIGLVAHGIDLLPDFGYPPVNYGGWDTPQFHWYRMPASHNLVVVDGQRHTNLFHKPQYGECIMWDIGADYRAGYFRAPEYPAVERFERLYALIDVSPEDCYCLDVFRVLGGHSHARFIRSTFSELTCTGLSPVPGKPYGHGTYMRDFMHDEHPEAGWQADFKVQDVFGVLDKGSDVHLRYMDLTKDAAVDTCESWIDQTNVLREEGKTVAQVFGEGRDASAWLPTLMQTSTSKDQPLFSSFAGLFVPYNHECPVLKAERVTLTGRDGSSVPDGHVGIVVTLKSGVRDILIARDPADSREVFYGSYGSGDRIFTFYRETGKDVSFEQPPKL